jgi:hypothetical protein
MYSTCLFCHASLGANEAVEQFPIGRTLAFDAAKGRLWAVCRKCERWNLTPIEERWEAIEECERSYRATKLRVSTDQIGLARLREGLELVRIGKPLRPEFAAWRYGDQFGRRRRKIRTRVALLTAGAVPILGPAMGFGFGLMVAMNASAIEHFASHLYRRYRVIARVRDSDGRAVLVRLHDLTETVILPPTADEPWGLRVAHRMHPEQRPPWWRYSGNDALTEIRGEEAMRAAAQLLPRFNREGATPQQVDHAVTLVTEHEDPSVLFERTAKYARSSWINYGQGVMLRQVPAEVRLALEMASHEDAERRALEGELHRLEDAWREAEEIAGISDDMFLPTEVSEKLAELKGRAG